MKIYQNFKEMHKTTISKMFVHIPVVLHVLLVSWYYGQFYLAMHVLSSISSIYCQVLSKDMKGL